MKQYFTKTPRIFMRIFSNYTWCFSSSQKDIYLTFDDGPTPEVTQFVLTELKKYNAKATFFCIGKNIEKYPLIFEQIIADGHSVGNHTYNHLNGWKTDTIDYVKNVEKTNRIISDKLLSMSNSKIKNQKLKLFRPPYGKIKLSQTKNLQKLGYKIIMWDVLSADFDATISKEKCLENVIKNAKRGSVIVFHDSKKSKEKLYYVLPKILKEFTKKGDTINLNII